MCIAMTLVVTWTAVEMVTTYDAAVAKQAAECPRYIVETPNFTGLNYSDIQPLTPEEFNKLTRQNKTTLARQ